MNRRQRRQLRLERMEGRRMSPRKYTPGELREMLVEDAVAGYGPASVPGGFDGGMAYLDWLVTSVAVIADHERKKPETVFLEIKGAVFAQTGRDLPP